MSGPADRPTGVVSIKDVAAAAGVSPATVSNVLNRPERVAPATRRKVLETIDAVGYVRNASASRLRILDNYALGLLIADIENPFLRNLAQGAQETAEEYGYSVLLCDAARSTERLIRQIDFLAEQQVTGVLASGSTLPGVGDALDKLRSRGTKVVLVDEAEGTFDHCSVGVDDERGGWLVGSHLLELGRRRIAYVTIDVPFRPFDDRLAGLRRAAAQHPDSASVEIERLEVSLESLDDGGEAAAAILAGGFDAVFSANDPIAIGLYRKFVHAGVSIPEDIALIGYDDVPMASMLPVPLSSVRQPTRMLGTTATKLLIEECADDDHEHQHVAFRPSLTARTSTLGT